MLAGIPGTGISVFFYLLSVCAILLTELVNTGHRRGDSANRRLAWLQLKILTGSVLTVGVSMWSYGYLISEAAGVLVPLFSPLVRVHSPWHAALIGPGVLLAVILSVEIASFVCKRKVEQTSPRNESLAQRIHRWQAQMVVVKFADD